MHVVYNGSNSAKFISLVAIDWTNSFVDFVTGSVVAIVKYRQMEKHYMVSAMAINGHQKTNGVVPGNKGERSLERWPLLSCFYKLFILNLCALAACVISVDLSSEVDIN